MKLIEVLGRKLEFNSVKKSDRIITISKSMKNILVDMGARSEKIDIVCDGVDTEIFRPFDRNNVRKRFGHGAENIIIFQGVIDPQDGPELVIEMSKEVLAKHPKTMFWIIGDGTAIPDLKQMAAEKGLMNHFYFSGWVKQEEVPKYISASDIGLVILPDVLSARGRVTLKEFEYWACGIPAVLPRLPALEEIAKDSKAAVFYEPGNGVSLAEKINTLIEDKNLRKTMGENGKKLVHEKYEWRTLTNQIVNLCEHYREILS